MYTVFVHSLCPGGFMQQADLTKVGWLPGYIATGWDMLYPYQWTELTEMKAVISIGYPGAKVL
jgi:hypothetical protein